MQHLDCDRISGIFLIVAPGCFIDEETMAQSLSPKTEIWRVLTFSLKKKNH